MKKRKLIIIEFIPIKNFKHKIKLTKEHKDHKLQVIGNSLYVEKVEVVADE